MNNDVAAVLVNLCDIGKSISVYDDSKVLAVWWNMVEADESILHIRRCSSVSLFIHLVVNERWPDPIAWRGVSALRFLPTPKPPKPCVVAQ